MTDDTDESERVVQVSALWIKVVSRLGEIKSGSVAPKCLVYQQLLDRFHSHGEADFYFTVGTTQ